MVAPKRQNKVEKDSVTDCNGNMVHTLQNFYIIFKKTKNTIWGTYYLLMVKVLVILMLNSAVLQFWFFSFSILTDKIQRKVINDISQSFSSSLHTAMPDENGTLSK